jgi:hypothetical protein
MDQFLDKAQSKSDQLDLVAQQKDAEATKQEKVVALKAEVENLRKKVNKFKKDNKKGGGNKSTDEPSSDSSNKAATIPQRSNERRKIPERIGPRSSTQSLSLQTLTSPSSSME